MTILLAWMFALSIVPMKVIWDELAARLAGEVEPRWSEAVADAA